MMEHKCFEEISVSDLCERLEIPRKSFYRYFSSKEGALFALLDHTFLEFYQSRKPEVLQVHTPEEELTQYFCFWHQHSDLLQAMLRSNLSGLLVERAMRLAKQEQMMPACARDWDDLRKTMASSFTICGLLSMVIQWHMDGYTLSPEKMAQIAVTMLSHPLI